MHVAKEQFWDVLFSQMPGGQQPKGTKSEFTTKYDKGPQKQRSCESKVKTFLPCLRGSTVVEQVDWEASMEMSTRNNIQQGQK